MNQSQINSLNAKLSELLAVDFSTIVKEVYRDQNIDSVVINEINLSDYIGLIKRMAEQLAHELSAGAGFFLPHQYNYQNEYGAGNLQNDLNSLFSHVRNLPASHQFLTRLVYYQKLNGFWDRSQSKTHNLRGLQITELENRLQLISENLSQHVSDHEKLKKAAEEKIGKLESLKNQKEKELETITTNLATSNQQTNQISELHNKTISIAEKINSTLTSSVEKLSEFKEESKEEITSVIQQQKVVEKEIAEASEKLKHFEGKCTEIDTHLADVEQKKLLFDQRNVELDELIGREVGASLFETFKQRKKELKPSVTFWKYAVPAMSIITIIGIYAVFSNLFGYIEVDDALTKDEWRTFALRSLKCLPLFILLYFSIHQYGKERHYKEEYAFKSATALTIKAYADLIEDKSRRDEMILSSVSGVYNSPVVSSKNDKNTQSKIDIASMVKEVSEIKKQLIKNA